MTILRFEDEEEYCMKTARFVLKIVGAALSLAAFVCLVIAFWDKLTACMIRKQESDDYDDAALYE